MKKMKKVYIIALCIGIVVAVSPLFMCSQKTNSDCNESRGWIYAFGSMPFGSVVVFVLQGSDYLFGNIFLVEKTYQGEPRFKSESPLKVGETYFERRSFIYGDTGIGEMKLYTFATFLNFFILTLLFERYVWQRMILKNK
jgi:hypothetical protein